MSRYTAPLRAKIRFLLITGQRDALLRLCKQVLVASRNQGDEATEALALVGLAITLRQAGKFHEARVCLDGALALPHTPPDVQADIHLERGWVALDGYYQADEAMRDFLEACHLAQAHSLDEALVQGQLGMASAHEQVEAWQTALQWAKEALQGARAALNTVLECGCWLVLGRVYERMGRRGRAEDCLRHATRLTDTLGYHFFQADVALLESLVAYPHAPQAAINMLSDSLLIAQSFAQTVRARQALSLQTNDANIAMQAAQTYLNEAQAQASKAHEAQAFRLLAQIASQQKDWETAIQHLHNGIDLARQTQNPFQQARLYEYLGGALYQYRAYPEAIQAYQAAKALYDALQHPRANIMRWQIWLGNVWLTVTDWLRRLGLMR